MSVGKVSLVGAGPGDPDLITVRGAAVLARADAVLYDALSHPDLLALCRPDAELHDVGKRPGGRYPEQDQITRQLVDLARQGKRVVRLKGGDPLLFARGAEEAEGLADAKVPFEIVPGLSSPVATSAFAGISLTHRDLSSSVIFITGTDRREKEWSREAWKRIANTTSTICVLMGMKRIRAIARALVEGGRPSSTPVAVVQWGACPKQRVVTATLETVADESERAGLRNPAVIVVGDVVELRRKLRFYDNQPLFGTRILVPRPEHQAMATAEAIRARGADPVVFPVIEIAPPPDPEPLRKAVRELSRYDWILFTSANGVDRFFAEVSRAGLDARALGSARVGAIGPKTAAALVRCGITADITAKDYVGEALADAVLEAGAGSDVLIPRALVAREDLPRALREAGASVRVIPAYQTRPVGQQAAGRFRQMLEDADLDVVMFTSGSTVSSVCDLLGQRARELLRATTVASIGPVTTKALEAHGIPVDVTAREFTVEGLLDALEAESSGSREGLT